MKTIDFRELYKPYSEMASLEETFTWLLRECKSLGISEDLAKEAISITFTEMNDGKMFSTESAGDKGFEGIPHADLNLYMKDMVVEMHKESITTQIQKIEKNLGARIRYHSRKNKRERYSDYLKRKSPIVRMFVKEEQNGS